jgi:hypothetical protein
MIESAPGFDSPGFGERESGEENPGGVTVEEEEVQRNGVP